MKRNWILAASLAVALGSTGALAEERAKGVPGVDVDVSSRDRNADTRNGVPGVDVDVSARKGEAGEGDRDERIDNDKLLDARQQVREAQEVLAKMQRDPDVAAALKRARGVLVSPDYGRAGLVVGGQGGNGVLLVRQGNGWTGPALYNLGGISVGAQVGASAGQRAMLLMSDKAVSQFRKSNDFALNADAGLTVVAWSAKAQARTGGDVIVWSDQAGAYAGATLGVNNVNFDERETAALYGRPVQAGQIIAGTVRAPASVTIARSLPVG